MMEIAELEAFKAIVDHGSVTQAAVRLNRVQSSISFRIKTLESRLGVRLFERTGRRIVATAAGHELYGYASEILDLVSRAHQALGQSTPSQKLKLGVIENFTIAHQSTLQRIIGNDLEIEVDIMLGNSSHLVEALDAGVCDAAIVGAGVAPEHLTRVALDEDSFVLIHGGEASSFDLASLDGCQFLVNSRRSASQRHVKELLTLHRATPSRVIECGSYALLFSQVAAGAGVSLVPRSLAVALSESYGVHLIELEAGFATFSTELVFADPTPSSSARRLAQYIQSLDRAPSTA